METIGTAADPAQVRRSRRRERRLEREREEVYRKALATVEGRALLWDLLERAGIFRSTAEQGLDWLAYRAGRQDFGHELQAMLIRVSADGFKLMQVEAIDRAKRLEREEQAEEADSKGAPS